MLERLSSHPLTLVLALLSLVYWTAGNRNGSRKLVYIGVGLTAAALLTFFFGL